MDNREIEEKIEIVLYTSNESAETVKILFKDETM
jgi:hypothetical protein